MRLLFKILIIVAIVLVSLFFVGLILVIGIMSSIGDGPPITNDSSSIENTYPSELTAEENEIYVFESENEELSNEVTFSLLSQTKYILDDETSILVKNLHRTGQTEEVPYRHSTYDTGLPYVTIGDSYLEIINHVEIISNQYKYSITINDCKISGRSYDDMAWRAIDSCEINVQREDLVNILNSESLYDFEKRLDTKSRSSTGLFEINNIGNNFFKLRFLDQHLGTTDKETYFNFVKSFSADFDIITNYGVQNIKSVNLWEENSVVIGPYKIKYTLLDIGNSNIKCKPSCRNVFDIKMQVEIISDPKDHSMKIVEYNTAITQKPASAKYSNLVNKPEFITTKDIPHYQSIPGYSYVDNPPKPIIYAQGKLVYDEDSKWSESHYRLIPEHLFGISWEQINEDVIFVHKENVTDELLDKKVRLRGIFIQNFPTYDISYVDEPAPQLIIKEANLVN